MNLKEFRIHIFLLDYKKSMVTPYYTTYVSTLLYAPTVTITKISICVKGQCFSIKEDTHEAFNRLLRLLS